MLFRNVLYIIGIMLYSRLFGKTNKTEKEKVSINATLLTKGGFIDQVMTGVYTFLPLGLRVLTKIENIIREEMDTIADEISMPALTPKQLWEETDRLNTVDILMKTVPANKFAEAKNDAEYVLNPTHEEVVAPLAKKYNLSYKDFPFALYQIQTKFRNEPRAKSGLLRGREFRMKDLYSFHVSIEDFKEYYENAKQIYMKVFERLGLGDETVIALASGGSFTDDYSHEFQIRCASGEDVLFYVKSRNVYYNKEVAPSTAPLVAYHDKEMLPRKDMVGKGIIGVKELAEYLNIPVEKTTKTLLFETETGEVIAAAVRGGYDVNEDKLRKAVGCKAVKLASEQAVKQITGAQVGYAGILNLPKGVRVFMDESMKNRLNFETGANKTDYHTINVNFGRDVPEPKKFYDIKVAKEGDLFPETKEPYEVIKTAEVGNIFPLYTKFTDAFSYSFTDRDGKQKPVYMGCYGIGSSRIMGVLVEKFHDKKGIVWPAQVAPFTVHLVGLDLKDETIMQKATSVYRELIKQNVDVLFDDRTSVTAGEKFSDADLIGIPHRLVVSKRTNETLEYKQRSGDQTEQITLTELVNKIHSRPATV